MIQQTAGLFGLNNTNHDFSKRQSWGKNIFNNTFPTALICYMHHLELTPVYLSWNENKINHGSITTESLFGLAANDPNLYFRFEDAFNPYQNLVNGRLPTVDLITLDSRTNKPLCALEIKLTALPDSTTDSLSEDKYGCEVVVRPTTIAYLALSLIANHGNRTDTLRRIFEKLGDWPEDQWLARETILSHHELFVGNLDRLLLESRSSNNQSLESPLLLQVIFKTQGRSANLTENCYDAFVWSNLAFLKLIIDLAKSRSLNKISRPFRSIIWLNRMLTEFSRKNKFNFDQITSSLSYDPRNDKAFAINGRKTNRYLRGGSPDILTSPRVPRSETRSIILGHGERYLSPERRLDAILVNSPNLFEAAQP